jgi:hypothetical protein
MTCVALLVKDDGRYSGGSLGAVEVGAVACLVNSGKVSLLMRLCAGNGGISSVVCDRLRVRDQRDQTRSRLVRLLVLICWKRVENKRCYIGKGKVEKCTERLSPLQLYQ